MPSFLETKCPGSHVLAVDNNENVLKVARNYFGFQGEAMIDDIHSALSKLSRLDKSFDAIVTDVGHNIRLNQEDMCFLGSLFKDFLGDVSEEVSGQNHILLGRSSPSRLVKLTLSTGERVRRKRLRTPVALMELQTAGDAVSFYDDTGIYWALQLQKPEESMPLLRLLLAAKAAGSGWTAMVELSYSESEAGVSAVSSFRLTAACSLPRSAKALQFFFWRLLRKARRIRLNLRSCRRPITRVASCPSRNEWPGWLLQACLQVRLECKCRLRQRQRLRLRGMWHPWHRALRWHQVPWLRSHQQSRCQRGRHQPCCLQLQMKQAKQRVVDLMHQVSEWITSFPGVPNGHPSAEIIRQYWSAVQDTGYGAPYAYLGALPMVPGLTRRADLPRVTAETPLSVPLSSASMGDLVAAMREVVRAEATPEGWQAERQKLERRAALLEEQLQPKEQLRDAMRAQHAQLADAQMMAQQMREHQLRLDGERQMRELEVEAGRSALEAELRQATAEAEQLAIAVDHQQRAESSAAAASSSTASLLATEARLAEQVSLVASLRQQLLSMTTSQTTEAISICRGVLGVTYVNLESSLPSTPDALVAAEAVRKQVRATIRQCGKVFEQQVQLGIFDDAPRPKRTSMSLFSDDDDDEVFVAKPKKASSPKARLDLCWILL
eukprot:g28736.t1